MAEPKTYPHGVPSWVDTIAHDLADAQRFYGGLFGWTFADAMPPAAPGHYLVATLDGQDVAAISSPDSDDEPITWRTYIAVDDADATAKAVDAGGGTIVGVEDSEWTKSASIRDPQGAEFVLSQFTPPTG